MPSAPGEINGAINKPEPSISSFLTKAPDASWYLPVPACYGVTAAANCFGTRNSGFFTPQYGYVAFFRLLSPISGDKPVLRRDILLFSRKKREEG
jgi:hypothetical protein